MERGPLLGILHGMKGTDKVLNVYFNSGQSPVDIRNVEDVEELHSSNGIRITTKENTIWLDAKHVSLCYASRDQGM